jgi:PAS domain S-box-containing protein
MAIEVAALLNVPLMANGTPVGLLYAHQSKPRAWTAQEVALVREVADRTWEAIGRTRAVEALRQINENLEVQIRDRTAQRDRMWTLSSDIMMITNTEGRILSVNPAWTSLLGWREEELAGASFFDFIHPEDLEKTLAVRKNLQQNLPIKQFENRYRTKAGGYLWLSWRAVPDGGIIHSVARDVTGEREQEAALQAAEESLRHAQKMEAVGQLTGGIAHDFNNLLQGIIGSLELVQKRIAQGVYHDIEDHAAQARQSAERAGALTHRLLAFSRRQPLAPQVVDANRLILEMGPLLRRTLGEQINLVFDLAAELWPTLCDPNQLDSALLNLAINARDAMPGGGTLTLHSRNLGPENICLAVIDTGVGMEPDVVERAFDPFYTTKPIGQGTGLGLSMVYGFMRQSGGEAKITSKPGSGTNISLILPRHVAALDATLDAALNDGLVAASAEPPSLAPIRQGQGSVLVLEDEPVVRAIVVEILEELGFSVVEAADGPAGLEILQSRQPVDLLITDIGLPGLNGRQVAEAARLTRPELKILFMTGYADTAAMADGFLQPGMFMVTKPIGIDALMTRIQTIMAPG